MTMHRFATAPVTALSRYIARKPSQCIRIFVSSSRVNDPAPSTTDKAKPIKAEPIPLSSCLENTVLTGLNYLKGQEPILAKKDEEYPPWLWTILKPKPIPDDGPGGEGEKMRLRAANRRRIKEQNFLKTQ